MKSWSEAMELYLPAAAESWPLLHLPGTITFLQVFNTAPHGAPFHEGCSWLHSFLQKINDALSANCWLPGMEHYFAGERTQWKRGIPTGNLVALQWSMWKMKIKEAAYELEFHFACDFLFGSLPPPASSVILSVCFNVLFPVYLVICFYITGVLDPLWIPWTDSWEKNKEKTKFISLFASHHFKKGSQEKLLSMHTPFTLHPLLMIFASGLIKPLIYHWNKKYESFLSWMTFFFSVNNTIFK